MKLLRYRQKTDWTCGPACLKVVLHFFGVNKDISELIKELKTTEKTGTDHQRMINLLKKYKLKFIVKKNATLEEIKKSLIDSLVVVDYFIPYYQESHYSIVKKIKGERIYFHDTHFGPNHRYKIDYFLRNWWDEEAKRWLVAIKKPNET